MKLISNESISNKVVFKTNLLPTFWYMMKRDSDMELTCNKNLVVNIG